MSLWVAGAFRSLFTSCLVPHHQLHHYEDGGGFAEGGNDAGGREGGPLDVSGLYSKA